MLKMVAGAERPGESAANSEGPHELKRAAEILRAERMTGEDRAAPTHVDRQQSVRPCERQIQGKQGKHPAGLSPSGDNAAGAQQPRSEDPVVGDFPRPRKRSGNRDVPLSEVLRLFLTERRTAAETASEFD